MKKILFSIFCSLVLVASFWGWATRAVSPSALNNNEIYVFIQKTCPHCHAAEAYIKEHYPDLSVHFKDIAYQNERALFFACGEKFGLNKIQMGTPLFCMGDKYILGWSFDEQKKFDEYVQEFLK